MAYTVYTTRAFVMAARDRATSDRSVRLFTEEAGALWARASGVRKEQSKMRYALQPFSFANVSLVRGKHEWRVTGAEPLHNVFTEAHDRAARARLVRAARLLSRLVHGEEPHRKLYAVIEEGFSELAQFTDPLEGAAEKVLALRMLHSLGYVAPPPGLAAVVGAPTLREAVTKADVPERDAELSRHIDRALAASHL